MDSPWNPSQELLVAFVCYLHMPSLPRSPRGLAHGTMKVYLSAVRHAHVVRGHKNPTADCLVLECALRAIKRRLGGPKKPRLPVTVALLSAMKEFFDLSQHDMRVVWAALTLGVFGMLRLGEMLGSVPLRGTDFEFYQDGMVALNLKASKTDVFREGVRVKVFRNGTPVDPSLALWDLGCQRPSGLGGVATNVPTFIMSDGKVLTKAMLVTFMRTLAAKVEAKYKIGLNAAHFSGHSLRRGGATSLSLRGVSSDVIRIMGRWRSMCYRLYIDSSNQSLRMAAAQMAMVTPEQVVNDLGVEQQQSPDAPSCWTQDDEELDD